MQFSNSGAYPVCMNPDHNKIQLSLVCLENNCQKRGVICEKCANDKHKGHNILNINDWIGQLMQRAGFIQSQQAEVRSLTLELTHYFESLLKTLSGLITDIQNTAISLIQKGDTDLSAEILLQKRIMLQVQTLRDSNHELNAEELQFRVQDIFQAQSKSIKPPEDIPIFMHIPQEQTWAVFLKDTIFQDTSLIAKGFYALLNKLRPSNGSNIATNIQNQNAQRNSFVRSERPPSGNKNTASAMYLSRNNFQRKNIFEGVDSVQKIKNLPSYSCSMINKGPQKAASIQAAPFSSSKISEVQKQDFKDHSQSNIQSEEYPSELKYGSQISNPINTVPRTKVLNASAGKSFSRGRQSAAGGEFSERSSEIASPPFFSSSQRQEKNNLLGNNGGSDWKKDDFAGLMSLQRVSSAQQQMWPQNSDRFSQRVATVPDEFQYQNSILEVPGLTCMELMSGDQLISGSRDGKLRIWQLQQHSIQNQEHKLIITLTQHEASISAIAFQQSARILATASTDGIILIWRHSPNITLNHKLVAHGSSTVTGLNFQTDRFLISAAADNSIILWDTETSAILKKIGFVNSNNSKIIENNQEINKRCSSLNRSVEQNNSRLSNKSNYSIHDQYTSPSNFKEGIYDLVVLDQVIVGISSGNLQFWELKTLRLLKKVQAHGGGIRQLGLISMRHKPSMLATCGDDGGVAVWEADKSYSQIACTKNQGQQILVFAVSTFYDVIIAASYSPLSYFINRNSTIQSSLPKNARNLPTTKIIAYSISNKLSYVATLAEYQEDVLSIKATDSILYVGLHTGVIEVISLASKMNHI